MRTTLLRMVYLLSLIFISSCAAQAQEFRADEVIAVERAALQRWGKGDPEGYLELYAPQVTYFDPTLDKRLDGREAIRALVAPFKGKIKVDRFDMINPKVERVGDMAVLSYNVINYMKQPDGSEKPGTRWNSTQVFQRIDGRWRTIHVHWSYSKPELKAP